MRAATLLAPAKLTVSLRVTGVRDDGYHLIDAEMVTLTLADELTFEDADAIVMTVGGPYAAGVPRDGRNLVAKALAAAGRTARVHIDKRIPHGGGLGGGSADAAATLRWAGVEDLATGVALGADVPFCMVGGRARVRGIGEIVDPLPLVARAFTLVVPPLSCSTPDVYAAWDALGAPRHDGPNDLEPAAIAVEPRLATWRDRIAEAAGIAPTLAGSGATWFVDGERPELADALAGATVTVTRTTG
jgi:4-diphosphocytidyl-2-C-methyl-D-erythritol kinase